MGCCIKKIIIAIDGFSSCGKSTFAKAIAAKLGYVFVDTGAMYRAVTYYAIQKGAASEKGVDVNVVIELLSQIEIRFEVNPENKNSEVVLNGENVERYIRSIQVSDLVSKISQIKQVREKLVDEQQKMGREKGIVMDGRDIGTVVFPNAELKIFMTADPALRAIRRYDELVAKGETVSLQEIEKNIRERDIADQNREISPLRKADDAIVLDNSNMTVEQQMEWLDVQLQRVLAV